MHVIQAIRRIYRRLIKERIMNRIISTYLVLFLAFALILSVGYYYMVRNSQAETFTRNNEKILGITANNFARYMNQISDLSLMLRRNHDLRIQLLAEDYQFAVESELGLIDYAKSDNLGIGKMEYYVPSTNNIYWFTKRGSFYDNWDYKATEWYDRLMDSPNYDFVETRYNTANPQFGGEGYGAVFHRNVLDIPTRTVSIIVNIYIEDAKLQDMVMLAQVNDYEHIFLLDQENQLFYSDVPFAESMVRSAGDILWGADGEVTIDGKTYIKVMGQSADNRWTMIKLVALDVFNQNLRTMMLLGVGVILFFAVLMFGVFVLRMRRIGRSFTQLLEHIDRVGQGDFHNQINIESEDEIGHLADEFNRMTTRIDTLINNNYRLVIREKDAQLRVLESQIDPHFLNNTLQAISGLAIEQSQQTLAGMLNSLAKSFRYKINREATAAVYEEIEHIQAYVDLLKLRYNDRLRVKYDIDFAVMDVLVPRMMLQCLVENSIKHALEKTTQPVEIRLSVLQDAECIIIECRDDGQGMLPDDLACLRERIRQEHGTDDAADGIGLINAYRRLRLSGADIQAFHIDSQWDHGFHVRIQFREGVAADETIDC